MRKTKPLPWLQRTAFADLCKNYYRGKNQDEIAQVIGVNPANLSQYVCGRLPVSREFIAGAILAFPGVAVQQYVTPHRPEVTE